MGIHKRVAPVAADGPDADRVLAWTAFWEDQGPESRCLASAPAETKHCLSSYWSEFASGLAPSARVLDIGCGSGAVGRSLLSAHPRVHVVGVDSARMPRTQDGRRMRIISGVAMECLPFWPGFFNAAVSQFGFEYGQTDAAAEELARVLRKGGRFSFLVHHSDSSIVRAGRLRERGLRALAGERVRQVFLAANEIGLRGALDEIARKHADDPTICFAARCLVAKLGRGREERERIWEALVDALAPELTLLDALQGTAVAPADLHEWLAPLRTWLDVRHASPLRVAGEPLAWKIEGVRGRRREPTAIRV